MGVGVCCRPLFNHIPWLNRFWNVVSRITYRTIQMSNESQSDTPTPRTALEQLMSFRHDTFYGREWVLMDDAERLAKQCTQTERELIAANARIAELEAQQPAGRAGVVVDARTALQGMACCGCSHGVQTRRKRRKTTRRLARRRIRRGHHQRLQSKGQ